uniref:Uncharacterized protein n=1 Tax=Pelagomonas calceolata TaxID=35677 RepID=A0A6S8RLZ2_9STRA
MAGRLARVRSKADSALDGHRYESTDSSDDEAMRAVPAGCLGRTGVRLVAEARAGEDERGRTGEKGYSVVDTNQFRNTQVGSGYQASFVVRQPGAAPAAPPKRAAPDARDAKKRKKPKDKKSKKKHKKKKDKKKKKRKASSSSSSDDDSADDAAAAVEPAYDDGVGGADVLPRRLAHFEALLTDALERRPAKKKRGNML